MVGYVLWVAWLFDYLGRLAVKCVGSDGDVILGGSWLYDHSGSMAMRSFGFRGCAILGATDVRATAGTSDRTINVHPGPVV